MSAEKNWQFELEEYIKQSEPDQIEKSEAWQAAIGLQAVDGLKTSAYLLDTAKEHIEGKVSIDEAQKRIQSYYEQRTDRTEIENDTKEADIVSVRIAKLLGEKAFQFSPAEWLTIHRRLFEGVFTHAGQIRQYNITKKEWVLKGDTVTYAAWNSIKDTLDYDFATEKQFSYEGLSVERCVKHLAKFASDIWQIHPFCEESAWKSQFISGLMQPIMTFVGNLGYVAVAVLGSVLAVNGTIEVGDIQAFIQYVKNFTQPITQIAQVSNMLQSAAAAAERVFEFLDEEEEEQTVEHPVSMDQLTGAVSFEHVRFGYTPDKIVIQDFSCEVNPGQMVAIVGPTGAGKTTMVKLLMRFYDVNSGRICLDGHDIRNFNRGQLREMFGMVLQDTWLFQGTIMENIRYGRLDATDEEVIAAAKAAHADHFIRTLPGGYQMELNEDATNVSQGQKQLLTIARAILADNPILILDEATSSVDTRTEIQIQKAMNNLMKGRTSFVIAHRLSTIRDADVILVMKDGDIAEQGTHEELLAKGGFYAQLYNSQFEKTA